MRTLIQLLWLLFASGLRLTASDTLWSASSDVTVLVSASANEFPIANAGPDQTITFANRALIQGRVTDDGLGGAVRTTLRLLTGPGTVTFGQTISGDFRDRLNTATFSAPGTYVLRFSAQDDFTSSFADDITITVLPGSVTPPSTAGNLTPEVNAGPDASVAIPSVLPLNGSVSDDGLPAGYPVSAYWVKVSGPGKAYITDSASLITTVGFSAAGTYYGAQIN
jgi:hypothetical protein